MTLKLSLNILPKFSRVRFTILLISGISTIVNGTLLNFGKRYKDNLRVIFDQWPKLHLGLDALSNQKNLEWYLFDNHYYQKILNAIYLIIIIMQFKPFTMTDCRAVSLM